MIRQTLPTVIYHNLNELVETHEMQLALSAVQECLHRSHVSAIFNAFFDNTKICISGIPYIRIKGLSTILRTGSSGAERPLIYQGMTGVLPPVNIIEINGEEHISGPMLRALIDTRMSFSSGKTKQYLSFAMDLYDRIINLSQIRDQKEVFLDEIRNARPRLKQQRIMEYGIDRCEFSGQYFAGINAVEFAHIDSVATNPMRALDIDNGVIILKEIHAKLTLLCVHDFEGMYRFCEDNGYSTAWTK